MPVDQALIVTTALLLVPFAVLVAAAARLGYAAGGLATHWKTTRRFVSAKYSILSSGRLATVATALWLTWRWSGSR